MTAYDGRMMYIVRTALIGVEWLFSLIAWGIIADGGGAQGTSRVKAALALGIIGWLLLTAALTL